MSGDSRRRHKLKSKTGLPARSVSAKAGILLDIGCGKISRPGFVGMDKRKFPNVDIVHDLEAFPYPLPKESVITMVASHIIEHIKPWLFINLMNELWRIGKEGCQLAISMPYGYSSGFLQDPTHCNACNEATWQYFDPNFPLYNIYEPKPWKITFGPVYQLNGNLEVILTKVKVSNPGGRKNERKVRTHRKISPRQDKKR